MASTSNIARTRTNVDVFGNRERLDGRCSFVVIIIFYIDNLETAYNWDDLMYEALLPAAYAITSSDAKVRAVPITGTDSATDINTSFMFANTYPLSVKNSDRYSYSPD